MFDQTFWKTRERNEWFRPSRVEKAILEDKDFIWSCRYPLDNNLRDRLIRGSDGFEVVIIRIGGSAVVIVGFAYLFVVEVNVHIFCWCSSCCVACWWAVVGTVFVEDAKVLLVAAMDWADVISLEARRTWSWFRGRTIIIIVVIIVIALIITIISTRMWLTRYVRRLVVEDIEVLSELVDVLSCQCVPVFTKFLLPMFWHGWELDGFKACVVELVVVFCVGNE